MKRAEMTPEQHQLAREERNARARVRYTEKREEIAATRKARRVLKPKPVFVPTPCLVDGCFEPQKARGWCNLHYQRVRNLGSPDLPIRVLKVRPRLRKACSVIDCDKISQTGLCRFHAVRMRRTGTTDDPPKRTRQAPEERRAQWSRSAARRYRRSHTMWVPLMVSCVVCEMEFFQKRYGSHFCSDLCRERNRVRDPKTKKKSEHKRRATLAGVLMVIRVEADYCGVCLRPLTNEKYPSVWMTTVGHEPPLFVVKRDGWLVVVERPEHWICNARKTYKMDCEMVA